MCIGCRKSTTQIRARINYKMSMWCPLKMIDAATLAALFELM